MNAAERLIAQILSGRDAWVELEPAVGTTTPALEVLVRRPAAEELSPFFGEDKDGKPILQARKEDAKRCVVNWRGFTEATLVGAAVGSSDPVEFDAALWAVVVADKVDWSKKVTRALLEQTSAFLKAELELEKN